MLSVSDASADGPLVGLISVTDEGSCSGIYTGATKPAWQTCDHTLTTFSPYASLVSSAPTPTSTASGSARSPSSTRRTARCSTSSRAGAEGPTVLQTAWEDDDHVLAVVYERGRWSVVRLGVDGSAELALGPLVGGDLDRPFVLEQD